jgi:aminomethyltransferase
MVKYAIEGKDAEAYLNRLTVRDVGKLQPGSVHYTVWCDGDGRVLDDGTLFRLAPDRFRLCCQERHLPWLLDSAVGFDVSVHEVTKEIAALSLQGPTSFAVLEAIGLGALRDLKPFRIATAKAGKAGEIMVSRTGFTGDLGYELWTTPDKALALWDLVFDKGRPHGVRAIGSSALNMARIEAGFIITNMDFIAGEQVLRQNRRRSPYELSLGWMIDFAKGHFNGRRALLAEKAKGGGKWALVGLDVEGNIPADHALIYSGKRREVGHVTAAIWSPSAKRNIALALLERPYDAERSGDLWAEIYAERELEYAKMMVRVRIAQRPFFDPPRRKATPPGMF